MLSASDSDQLPVIWQGKFDSGVPNPQEFRDFYLGFSLNSALLFLSNQRLLDCCSSPSILYFFVHSIQKSVFCPSTLSSLDEACYRDWHTFGVPEIWFVHLSMKRLLFFRGLL